MPSSSAYAAPIDLDLRPGRWHRGGLVVAGLLVVSALVLSDLTLLAALSGAALSSLILLRDHATAARRPTRLRLYADGSVECPLLQNDDDLMQPATLLQATTFLGLTQLRWSDANDAHHACVLFPDRLDADTRHRLRVWLATHRPSRAPFPVPRAPGAPESAPT